jgi:hypothetical protein
MEFWLSRSLFSRTFSFFTMESWLSRSLFHELFLLLRWNSSYHEAFSHELFSFFTMESWLSRSLFHELLFLFSQWNPGYHEAFLTNFFFFHDGISAIMEPFSRTFSFFMMEFRLSGSLSHELFLFSRWNFGYHGAFHDRILETCNLGEDSFHIYISERVFT